MEQKSTAQSFEPSIGLRLVNYFVSTAKLTNIIESYSVVISKLNYTFESRKSRNEVIKTKNNSLCCLIGPVILCIAFGIILLLRVGNNFHSFGFS